MLSFAPKHEKFKLSRQNCFPVDFEEMAVTMQKYEIPRDLFHLSSLISILLCYTKQLLE